MTEIQNALVECIEACVNEIRKSTQMVDVEEVYLDNAILPSFDILIERQLNPIWHRVSPRLKLIISDLKTLRRLLVYLVTYDPITFHLFLETILAANAPNVNPQFSNQSPWLFSDAANVIFRVSLVLLNFH